MVTKVNQQREEENNIKNIYIYNIINVAQLKKNNKTKSRKSQKLSTNKKKLEQKCQEVTTRR